VFADHPLNPIQRAAAGPAFGSPGNLLVVAPTSSGKTRVAFLAMCRVLEELPEGLTGGGERPKVLLLAPLRALVSEFADKVKRRFAAFAGLRVAAIVGEDAESDGGGERGLSRIAGADVIVTTPEKADAMTRGWGQSRAVLQAIRLVVVDEVHMVGSRRGPALEAVLSRLKHLAPRARIVALSATVPNAADVARWIGATPEHTLVFPESARPVPIERVVLSYPRAESDWKFERNLNFKLAQVVRTHASGRPALVFCATRNGAVTAAEALANEMLDHVPSDAKALAARQTGASQVADTRLAACLLRGIGFHTAALRARDRAVVERLFADRCLAVLATTRTLAMGVNLPAHCVIVKGTTQYSEQHGTYCDYSTLDVLQMIGRAGRPQFDQTAVAVILTTHDKRSWWERASVGKAPLESSLLDALSDHLNAEVASRTVTSTADALAWLSSTFLSVRLAAVPAAYGIAHAPGTAGAVAAREQLVVDALQRLAELGLVQLNSVSGEVRGTPDGALICRHYVATETVHAFRAIGEGADVGDVLRALVSGAAELSGGILRRTEKKVLNALAVDEAVVRYPPLQPGKRVKEAGDKVLVLLQATLSHALRRESLTPSLRQDAFNYRTALRRVLRALPLYLAHRGAYRPLVATLLLAKSAEQQLWYDSTAQLTQLRGIGDALASKLRLAGIVTIPDLLVTPAPRLAAVIGGRAAEQARTQATELPRYDIAAATSEATASRAVVDITVQRISATAPKSTWAALVIGDDGGNLLAFELFPSTRKTLQKQVELRSQPPHRGHAASLRVSIIKLNFVGADAESVHTVVFDNALVDEPYPVEEEEAEEGGGGREGRKGEEGGGGRRVGTCRHRCAGKGTCRHKCCNRTVGEGGEEGEREGAASQSGGASSVSSQSTPAKRRSYPTDATATALEAGRKAALRFTAPLPRLKMPPTSASSRILAPEDSAPPPPPPPPSAFTSLF
jgi:ATP-dependent DNA helicase HFM1/MER3